MSMKHSAQDRCDDRCGAQAYVTYVNEKGHILSFCGHHDRKYADTLFMQGFTVSVDDRPVLDAQFGKIRDAASAV